MCVGDIQSMDKQVKHILIMTLKVNIYHLKFEARPEMDENEARESRRRDEVKVSINEILKKLLVCHRDCQVYLSLSLSLSYCTSFPLSVGAAEELSRKLWQCHTRLPC